MKRVILTRNLSTPESRAIWAAVDEAARDAERHLPESVISSIREQARRFRLQMGAGSAGSDGEAQHLTAVTITVPRRLLPSMQVLVQVMERALADPAALPAASGVSQADLAEMLARIRQSIDATVKTKPKLRQQD